MLLNVATQRGIAEGSITLVFRRWQRPTVKAGGRLRTSIGEIAIEAVDVVDPATITDDEARCAGASDADAVRHELFRERPASSRGRSAQPSADSVTYRIAVRFIGADQRVALRASLLSEADLGEMVARLAAMDSRSTTGPWTTSTLELIAAWPGRRAPELAEMHAMDTVPWKARVRRLKELGLTESLTVGYRLSPRGEQVLAKLSSLC